LGKVLHDVSGRQRVSCRFRFPTDEKDICACSESVGGAWGMGTGAGNGNEELNLARRVAPDELNDKRLDL
jgi:hypothetical protein